LSRSTLTAADLGAFEADGEAEDFLLTALDFASLGVEPVGDLEALDVDGSVETALGEDVDEHGERKGILEDGLLGIDIGLPGNGVAHDDGHDFLLDELDDALEGGGVLGGVTIEAVNEFLPGCADDLAGKRKAAEEVVGAGLKLEGALVLELADDIAANDLKRGLGVDEVVVEEFLEGDECVVGLLLEDAVAIACQSLVEVGGALLPELADAGAFDLLVVANDLTAAFQLAGDALRLVHEEDHDVKHGLPEVDGQGCIREVPTKRNHLVIEQLETLDLNLGAREAVEDGAVLLLGLKELAEEDADHVPVKDHAAARLDLAGLGRIKKGADDDGCSGDVAKLADEIGVGAFAGAGSAAEEDEFLWEPKVFAAVILFEIFPDAVEDELGVLNLEILGRGFLGGVLDGGAHWKEVNHGWTRMDTDFCGEKGEWDPAGREQVRLVGRICGGLLLGWGWGIF